LFWAAFAVARGDKTAMERLGHFLNQYGLCRNLSFTAILSGLVLVAYAWKKGNSEELWWAALAGVLGAAMFLRYMKFYRHYAIEVLTTYAYAKLACHGPKNF
jgi:uncharacterized membrane protein YdcZ (DUF606 family)